MSSKDKYGKFKKKHLVRSIYGVRNFLCDQFGYGAKPYVFETRLPKDTLMAFFRRGKASAIFYDYQQFKDEFGRFEFEIQEAYAAAIVAHEMRHYYQHRQIEAKHPRESAERIELWRENCENLKETEEGYSVLEVCLQPLELDASLFEYTFGAENFGKALLLTVNGIEHLTALEQLHVEYFGETDEELFGEKIKELIK